MKMLTQDEYDALLADRIDRDRLLGVMASCTNVEEALRAGAESLVALCDRHGYVLTVEQWSVPPLAMGRYKTVATIRRARGVE